MGEEIAPPHVGRRRRDPDVVGHDVDEDSEIGVMRRVGKSGEPVGPAPLGVDATVVDDVVAVVGAFLRRQ